MSVPNQQQNPGARTLVQSPDYFLFDVYAGGRLLFVPVSRRTYLESPFLDHRMTPRPESVFHCPFREIAPLTSDLDPPETVIAHTSFCASTLFARCIEIPQLMVLREPRILNTLANDFRNLPHQKVIDNGFLHATWRLLGKRYETRQRVVVKFTNFTNNLLRPIQTEWPATRILIMWGELEAFLISMLKHEHEAGQQLWMFLKAFLMDQGVDLSVINKRLQLPLMKQAIWTWSLQIQDLCRLAEKHPENVRSLSADQFLADPIDATRAFHRWLGFDATADEVKAHVSEVMGQDSKTGKSMDSRSIRRTRRQLQKDQAGRIEELIAWAENQGLVADTESLDQVRLLG
jgi:hypothetical protein